MNALEFTEICAAYGYVVEHAWVQLSIRFLFLGVERSLEIDDDVARWCSQLQHWTEQHQRKQNELARLKGRRACVLSNRAYYFRQFMNPDSNTERANVAKKASRLSMDALNIQREILELMK